MTTRPRAAVAYWRARMGTAEAAEIYKARAILLWHALAHNLMRAAALQAVPAR